MASGKIKHVNLAYRPLLAKSLKLVPYEIAPQSLKSCLTQSQHFVRADAVDGHCSRKQRAARKQSQIGGTQSDTYTRLASEVLEIGLG